MFDANLYAKAETLTIALRGEQTGQERSSQETAMRWTNVHIWADSKVTMAWLQHTAPGPGKWLARRIITTAPQLAEQGVKVEIH